MKKDLIFCITIIMLTAYAAKAQTDSKVASQDQSLDETIHFLKDKLSNNASYKGYDVKTEKAGKRLAGHSVLVHHLISEVIFDTCSLKYRYDYSESPGVARIYLDVIVLGDIDPSKIKVEGDKAPYLVKLFTIQGEPKIKREEKIGASSSPVRTSLGAKDVAEVAIPFSERAIAEQVVKALSNAANLCKVKKEPS